MRQIQPSDNSVDEAGLREVAVTTIGSVLVHLRCVLTVVNLKRTSVRKENMKHIYCD